MNLVFGENGIVTKAKDAREQTIIGHEKEQINLAYSACKTRENFEDLVTAGELETEMKKSNENVSVAADGDNLVITFEETKHQYNIGQDGNFKENTNQNIDWSTLEPGLYKTGTSEMIKSWQELIDDGDITVEGTKLNEIKTIFSYDQDVTMPLAGDLIISNDMTEIGSLTGGKAACYVGKSGITGVYVPSSVKKLTSSSQYGYGGFFAMFDMKKIVIEEGLEEIGDYSFASCYSLIEVELPDSVTTVGDYAFAWSSNIVNVKIPDNVILGKACFISNRLTQIPQNITSIGETMFANCEELKVVNIPNGITSIGARAFSGCGNITSINIPSSVKVIGEGAFLYCGNITSINIPNSIKKIGREAFKNCVNLSDINGFDNVISVGQNSLDGTKWYSSQPDGEVYIGKTLYNYKGTMSADTRLRIKEGTENIADCAFRECTGLIEVTFPASIKNIGEYCFYNCKNLSVINTNENIERIGDSAFFLTKWENNREDGEIYIENIFYKYKGSTYPKEIQIKDGTISITGNAIYPDTIIIPRSMKYIGKWVLGRDWDTPHNCVVNYMGTEEEWNSIEIEGSNFSGNLTINYNYTGE